MRIPPLIGAAFCAGVMTVQAADSTWMTHGLHPSLQVEASTLHPLIDQLHVSATVVPWTAPDSNDLLVRSVHSHYFGSRLALFRQTGVDDRGLPIYDAGTTITGVEGSRIMASPREDGLFDLFANGEGTPFGSKSLICHRATNRAEGRVVFEPPYEVRVNGRGLDQGLNGKVLAWYVGDLNGDKIPDLLAATVKRSGSYFPGGSMWNGTEQKDSGSGRGYDVNGLWLGDPTTSMLVWAQGSLDEKKQLSFGPSREVHFRRKGFAVQWKSWEGNRSLAFARVAGQPSIIHGGGIDQVLALPVEWRGEELFATEARPLLSGDGRLGETYYSSHISTMSSPSPGVLRLLVDGNPGRLVVIEGEAAGAFREVGSLSMRGGPLAADTLATPVRIRWDADEYPDLITGDASGYLTLWPGTADPLVYQAPIAMTSEGRRIHHQAGESGSIQGPNERRWGYLQPTAGDWKGKGKASIITNDINGAIVLYEATDRPSELAAPRQLTLEGKPLPAAWRSRPAILPAAWNVGGSGKPALLYLDWDGDLAIATPRETGSTEIVSSKKLSYGDGRPVRLSGPAGLWGRAELAVADWDGDGVWDVLFGTNRGCLPHIMAQPPKGAAPLWLRNIGTAQEPVFQPPQIIRERSGEAIELGVHTSAVWPTDLDGDGRDDLLIGAEDGKVYPFFRKDLQTPN